MTKTIALRCGSARCCQPMARADTNFTQHLPSIRTVTCEDLRPDVDWGYLRGSVPPIPPTIQEIANG